MPLSLRRAGPTRFSFLSVRRRSDRNFGGVVKSSATVRGVDRRIFLCHLPLLPADTHPAVVQARRASEEIAPADGKGRGG